MATEPREPTTKHPLARGLGALVIANGVMFGLMWVGFGALAFFMIWGWEREFHRKVAVVDGGTIPAEIYRVESFGTRDKGGKSVALRSEATKEVIYKPVGHDRLKIGDAVPVYRFHGERELFIPATANHVWWGKWLFLGFGVVPPSIVGCVAYYKWRRRRDAALAPSSPSTLPAPFTLNELHFDRLPTDEQLLAILGSSDYSSSTKIEEKGGRFAVRPWPIPVGAAMGWMTFVAIGMTVMLFAIDKSDSQFDNSVKWAMACLIWFAILPAMGAIFKFINKHMTERGDYVRADAHRGTLELPANDVTLTRDRIAAIVSVRRYFAKDGSGWTHAVFTNVLAHDGHGGYDYYPVLREAPTLWGGPTVAYRLAKFLRVPLREVKRNRRESRQLDERA